jgi:predicted transcriptional regulator of viral defense system
MKSRSYVADERALVTLAASQGGYFTSKQAAAIGYTAPKRNYHVHVGNWARERRGIFRLSTQPLPARPDLILWWLWSRNREEQPQGVYSHQTALSLHELTDAMPSRLNRTVPKTFRRSAPIPKSVVLHMSDLPASDVEQIDRVLVTKALRTLIDVAASGEVPLPDLQLAFAEATRSGKITRAEIAVAKTDAARRDVLRLLQGKGGKR